MQQKATYAAHPNDTKEFKIAVIILRGLEGIKAGTVKYPPLLTPPPGDRYSQEELDQQMDQVNNWIANKPALKTKINAQMNACLAVAN